MSNNKVRLYLWYTNKQDINTGVLIAKGNKAFIEQITFVNNFWNVTSLLGNNVLYYDDTNSIVLDDGCYTISSINKILFQYLSKFVLSDSGTYFETRIFNSANDWYQEVKANSTLYNTSSLSVLNTQIYENRLDIKIIKLRTNLSFEYHSQSSGTPALDNEIVFPCSVDLQESQTIFFNPPLEYDITNLTTI